MGKESKRLVNFISGKSRILIVAKDITSTDQATKLAFLYLYLKEENIETQIVMESKMYNPALKIMKRNGIKFSRSVLSESYTIAVNYADQKIEKISYDIDEDNSQILFHIYPEEAGFDFKNINYKNIQDHFDGILMFDVEEREDLGSIYSKNQRLFKKAKLMSISSSDLSLYSIVFDILRNSSDGGKKRLLPRIAQLLTDQFVYEENYPIGYSASKKKDKMIAELVALAGTFQVLTDAMENSYRKKSISQTVNLNKLLRIEPYYQEFSDDDEILLTVIDLSELDKKSLDYFEGAVKNEHRLEDLFKIHSPFYAKPETVLNVFMITGLIRSVVLLNSYDCSKYDLNKIKDLLGGRGADRQLLLTMDKLEKENAPEIIANIIKDVYN